MIYTNDFAEVPRSVFRNFIEKISDDFVPILLPRIDIDRYYNKLRDLSSTVFCIENGVLIGMASTYCNDMATKLAYTTLVGVDRDYRGKHIATELMRKTIVDARNHGMEKIGIHTNNPYAKDLYQKIGFQLIRGGITLIHSQLDTI